MARRLLIRVAMNPRARSNPPRRTRPVAAATVVLLTGSIAACSLSDDESTGDAAAELSSLTTKSSHPYPNCGGSTTDATPVELTWKIQTPASFTGGAPLVVANVTKTAQLVAVKVRFKGPTGVVETALNPIVVAAQSQAIVTIPSGAAGALVKDTTTPITAVVSADVAGQVVWAPHRSLHPLASGGAYRWYGEQERAAKTRAIVKDLLAAHQLQLSNPEGDALDTMYVLRPASSFQELDGAWKAATNLGEDAFAAVGNLTGGGSSGGGPGAPNGEGSPPPDAQTLCYRLNTDFSTGGVDFADEPYHQAKGAKIWLSIPNVGTFFGVTSRDNGCVNIPALPEDFIFFTGMYFESHVGDGEDRNIRIRTFDHPSSPWSRDNWDGTAFDVPRNAYMVFSSGAGSVTPLSTHPNNWRMANMLAVGSQMMAHYDAELGDGSPFTHWVNFETNGCVWGDDVSCAWFNEGFITEHDGGVHKAELIGHEFGHIVDSVYATHHLTSNYDVHDDTPACDSYGELHALDSREHQSAAALEGFASALGAVALSAPSTHTWRYYKSIAASGGLYDNQVIELDNAADFDHLENDCSCAGDCTSVFGVESDWLRFFWDYWPSSGTDMAVFFQRYSNAAQLAGNGDAYERLRLQTPAGAQRAFFEGMAETHGVDGSP